MITLGVERLCWVPLCQHRHLLLIDRPCVLSGLVVDTKGVWLASCGIGAEGGTVQLTPRAHFPDLPLGSRPSLARRQNSFTSRHSLYTAMGNISGPLSTQDKKQVQALIAMWKDNGYDASKEEGPKQAGVQLSAEHTRVNLVGANVVVQLHMSG